MIKNIKQLAFVFAGLAIITTFFLFTKPINVEAASKEGKKFNDWTVTCVDGGDVKAQKDGVDAKARPSNKICLLSQQVNVTENGTQKPLALYQIGYFEGEDKKKVVKLICSVPPGILVNVGVSMIVDAKVSMPGMFVSCNQNGCQSVTPLSEANIKELTDAKEAAFAFMTDQKQQISMPFSVKGLLEGLKFLAN